MIVVATTLTTFAMDDSQVWSSWLAYDRGIAASHDVRFFAAIEIDGRGTKLFDPLTTRLADLGGEWLYFKLDDGRSEVTTANRQRHITMGENLCSDYATQKGATHMLFVAADCSPPPDVIPMLLEVKHPLVAAEVPTY